MSLINDALKQAQQTRQKNAPPAAPVPPLHPVEPESRGGSGWLVLAAVALILAGVFCAWFALNRRTATTSPPPATNPPVAAAKPGAPAARPPVVTNLAAKSNLVATVPAPPKLQAIVYDPARPWAIIDGRAVYVGDPVRAARVTKSSPDSVTLVSATETNILRTRK